MPDDFLKLPLQSSLNRAATARAEEAIQNTGRALPCKVTAVEGSIVTVTFEANIPYQQPDGTIAVYQLPPITLAKAESQWMRSPTQVGDFGLTLPADTFLGGISGIGTGVADTGVDYGNLSGTRLVWVPVAALSFASAPSPAQAYVNGPEGVFVSDTAQTATHVVDVPTLGTPGTIASTIHNPAGAGATTVEHVLDGVNNKITHALTNASGTLQTIVDGNGNAISHVVPTGGLLGLGALASTLDASHAAFNKTHITDLMTNSQTSRIQDISTIMASLVAAGVPNIATAVTHLLALSVAPSPLGILAAVVPLPTIPGGSAIARLPT